MFQNPHSSEPEYVSAGRLKKLTADRAAGRLDEKALEGVLKEMRDSIPQQDKVRVTCMRVCVCVCV